MKDKEYMEFTLTNSEGKETKVYLSKERYLALKEYEKKLKGGDKKLWYNE